MIMEFLVAELTRESAEHDPLYVYRPFHYGPTSHRARGHGRELPPETRMTTAQLTAAAQWMLRPIVNAIARPTPAATPVYCPVANKWLDSRLLIGCDAVQRDGARAPLAG